MTSLESWKEETWAWTHPPQIRWRTGCSGGRLALMPRAVVTSAPSGSPEDLLTTHYWPDPSCFCVSPSSQVILRLLVQGHHSWELLASNSKEKLLTRANNSLKKKNLSWSIQTWAGPIFVTTSDSRWNRSFLFFNLLLISSNLNKALISICQGSPKV